MTPNLPPMRATDPNDYLWQNISRLMGVEDAGVDAVFARCKRAGVEIGRGTVQRLKEGETSSRLNSLVALSETFGIEVWQLLAPELEPRTSAPSDFSPEATELATQFDEIEDRKARARAFAHCMTVIVGATPGGQKPEPEDGQSGPPTAQPQTKTRSRHE